MIARPGPDSDPIASEMPVDHGWFRPRSWKLTAGAFAAIIAVGAADFLTGPQITFSAFYLVPVSIAAWVSGMTAAVAASALAAVVWFFAELASKRVDENMFVYAWNFCVRLLFLALVAVLLARLRDMLDRERNLSRTDALTGLDNARRCQEVLRAEIERAKRYGQALSVAFVDVDDFKQVNDSRGHVAGDQLLVSMARAFRSNLRSSDFVARYGGDEFVILLPAADQGAARTVIEKLVARVGETMTAENWPVTLSVGVVTCDAGAPAVTVDSVLKLADRVMYEVKSHGKGGSRFAKYSS